MARKIRHFEKKELIHNELMKCARSNPIDIVCYSDFGVRTDTLPRGPSKEILDLIAKEEEGAKRPDITVLLVRKDTGYPGQIDGKITKALTPDDKLRAREKLQTVIDAYSPGATNPW